MSGPLRLPKSDSLAYPSTAAIQGCSLNTASGLGIIPAESPERAKRMKFYHRAEWRAFRKEIIRLHDGICHRCSRGPTDGVILQVHHKIYIAGRLPWQYRPEECETLCRGCHAEEHGKIMPRSGWEHFGDYDDLGSPDGECELCQTSIRYVFPVHHAKWGTMEVGEICCDHLTSTTFATEQMTTRRRLIDRRKRFVSSPRWKKDNCGSIHIAHKDVRVCVEQNGGAYRLQMNGIIGKHRFDSVLEAKIKAFDFIESGEAAKFFSKVKRRAMDYYYESVR